MSILLAISYLSNKNVFSVRTEGVYKLNQEQDIRKYNDLMSIIKGRRSIRSYKPDPIADDIIEKIIEAGIWAPTGSNQQEIKFAIIKRSDLLEEFALFKKIKSPVVVLVFADMKHYYSAFDRRIKNLLHKRHLPYIDAGLAMMNMTLAAKTLGISSCILNVSPYLYYDNQPERSLFGKLLRKIALIFGKSIAGIYWFPDFLKKCDIDMDTYKIISALAIGYAKNERDIDIKKARHGKKSIMRGNVKDYIIKTIS